MGAWNWAGHLCLVSPLAGEQGGELVKADKRELVDLWTGP